ncbi:porin [Oricola nitratireducens]|uniref:porin n=1 Tax=Oricola nitratireducens TaxID=2775868 RepID=UPI001867EDFB|nr:porin [Oricola nitratireducens]
MKIKSLLLGSAAALVAVSGARAADAVVIPEPEAVEYVRVCDAAGTGYFYIPGTETCLKIGGYVRYDIGAGDLNGIKDVSIRDATPATPFDQSDDELVIGNDTWFKRARASVNIDTYRDTDYGALKTHIETRWQYDTNGSSPYAARGFATGDLAYSGTGATVLTPYGTAGEFSINFAWMDLGGLRIGKSESLFTTFTGYGGSVINDTTGGGYGPFDTNLIQYTFSSGAFTAAMALEEQAGGVLLDDYMPHVVGGVGFDAGMVNLTAVLGYDTNNDAYAAKIRGDVDITDNVSAFLMLMYGENASGYNTWGTGLSTQDTFSVMGGASIGLTDAAKFNTQIQWAEGNGGSDVWSAVANVNYTVTPGFVVTPEVQYLRDNAGDSAWGGYLRFQTSF